MIRSFLPAVFLVLTWALFLPAADETAKKAIPVTGTVDRRLAPFDKTMIAFMQAHPEITGATLAVARDGKIVYNRGFGLADGKMAMKPDAKMRIASISKPITAAAILRLIENGLLRLDDKVFQVLGLKKPNEEAKFDPRWLQVTVQHLLQHTAGWDRDKSFDPMFRNDAICAALNIKSPARQAAIIRYMLTQPLQSDPGTRYAYSNFGYCLLGRVIEKVSGLGYEEYVRREILTPIGARATRLGKTLQEERLAGEVVYDCGGKKGKAILGPDLGKQVLIPYGVWDQEILDSHGGWVSTAGDLVRFGAAFDHPERCPILNANSIATMFACPPGDPGHDKNGKEKAPYYGCGWSVRPLADATRDTWHAGLLTGTSTLLVRRGRDHLTWAVLFNHYAFGEQVPTKLIDPLLHAAADEVKEWP